MRFTLSDLAITGLIIAIGGTWIFSDAWYSLALYLGKPDEKWLKNHSIRAIRAIWGAVFILLGLQLIIWGVG